MSSEYYINVGLGKIVIAQSPAILIDAGIGSCVILCLYHSESKTAGAAHIMLPGQDNRPFDTKKPAKYADSGIKRFIDRFDKMGMKSESLVAKLIGGAQLFHFSQVPNIGEHNLRMTRKILREMKIRVVASDVGGDCGRSIWFFAETGKIRIHSRIKNKIEI